MLTCLLSALRLECLGSSAPCELFVIITIYLSAFLQGLRCFGLPFSISLLEQRFAACDFQGHGMINIRTIFFLPKGRSTCDRNRTVLQVVWLEGLFGLVFLSFSDEIFIVL